LFKLCVCWLIVVPLVFDNLVPVAPAPPVTCLEPATVPLMLLPDCNLVEAELRFRPIEEDDPERLPLLVEFIPYLTALDSPRLPVWCCLPV
jgi:hypothetical protein